MNSMTNFLLLIVVLLCHETAVAFVSLSPACRYGSNLQDAVTSADDVATTNGATTADSAKDLSTRMGTTAIFTSEDIDKILPHRYPFALVDRVVEYEAGKRAVGIKSVTKVCTAVEISFSCFYY
jgi:hypothetical protein